MQPKISIITPSFNQAKYIETSILSVLSQKYPNLEYFIFDNQSDDGTKKILEKYKNIIKVYYQKDNGQTEAINKGLKIATGEIITYLNSDDILLPVSLNMVATYFMNNPEIHWVTGKCNVIDDKGKKYRSFITVYKNFSLKFFRNYTSLLTVNYISQPAVFWRREALLNIGNFDKSLHYAMDYDYWLRLGKIYRLGFIDKYLASYRMHSKSKSQKNIEGLFDEGYNVAKRYCGFPLTLIHKMHDKIAILIYRILQ